MKDHQLLDPHTWINRSIFVGPKGAIRRLFKPESGIVWLTNRSLMCPQSRNLMRVPGRCIATEPLNLAFLTCSSHSVCCHLAVLSLLLERKKIPLNPASRIQRPVIPECDVTDQVKLSRLLHFLVRASTLFTLAQASVSEARILA